MKRLNPSTGKPFVRGDTRADGFLFVCYVKSPWLIKKDGYFTEHWSSPEKWKKSNVNAEDRKKYRANNPDKFRSYYAKRRAAKLQRTPPWLTKEHLQQIESVYELAKRLTDETGVMYHVDHIVPLRGEFVSGLHVPWNLRAIPATENRSKSNQF